MGYAIALAITIVAGACIFVMCYAIWKMNGGPN